MPADNQKQQQKKAETKQEQKRELKKKEERQEKQPRQRQQEPSEEFLIRVLGRDIPGSKNLLTGLTRVKGVSWAVSNAACIKLALPKNKKISELTKDEIKKIEDFLKNAEINDFLKNRRKDLATGESKHLVSTDLDMRKDFDIRRLKKIRSYKGIRHTANLPVRGQRTRSHFRKKGQAVKVRKK